MPSTTLIDDVAGDAAAAAAAERDVTTPRGFRDRADDSLLTLIGEIPELDPQPRHRRGRRRQGMGCAAPRRTAGSGRGCGSSRALFVLFWSVPVLGTFVIAGLSSWWPVVAVGARRASSRCSSSRRSWRCSASCASARSRERQNPVQSIAQDVKEVRDEL